MENIEQNNIVDLVIDKIAASNGCTHFEFEYKNYTVKYDVLNNRRFTVDLGFEFKDRPKFYYELDDDLISIVAKTNERKFKCLNIDDCFYQKTNPERLIATKTQEYLFSNIVTEYTKFPSTMSTVLNESSLRNKLETFLNSL